MAAADPMPEWLRLNRMNWDERAGIHAASKFYGVPEFQARSSTLRSFERGEVGDVSGRSLLHLQCHMGQDTLSWARLGAHAVGLDFSEPAIRTARQLAEDVQDVGQTRFVVSDVYDAEAALQGERFDIVYTGLGALVWLPDLVRWAKVVASLLNPGGFLYLVEFHPLSDMLGDDGRAVEQDYFDTGGREVDYQHTYTDGPAMTNTRQSNGSTHLVRCSLRWLTPDCGWTSCMSTTSRSSNGFPCWRTPAASTDFPRATRGSRFCIPYERHGPPNSLRRSTKRGGQEVSDRTPGSPERSTGA